jgi:1-acyl-sn-glycerol-3-phosphate acyltransferase
MWIGSPLRGAFRLLTFLSVTLVLVPIYFLILALRIGPIIRWMPVAYHRLVCIILGIKVRVHGERSDAIPTLFVCNHVSYLDIVVLGGLIPVSFVAKAEVATLAVLLDPRQGAAHHLHRTQQRQDQPQP